MPLENILLDWVLVSTAFPPVEYSWEKMKEGMGMGVRRPRLSS